MGHGSTAIWTDKPYRVSRPFDSPEVIEAGLMLVRHWNEPGGSAIVAPANVWNSGSHSGIHGAFVDFHRIRLVYKGIVDD